MKTEQARMKLDTAEAAGHLSSGAAANIRQWLTEPRYASYVPAVVQHIADEQWQTLDDVFWTVIPFGTGGRRGRMYPIGTNAINDRTIGESAQGLASYVLAQAPSVAGGKDLSCAIAYDTRHRSRHFAELCAGIMVAAGFRVYFLDGYRSTPELSFLVRQRQCTCGIMVTASHNPPSDNAVKIYWSTGGQVLPPHDKAIIEHVLRVEEITHADFASAVADGKIRLCSAETDAAFLKELAAHGFPGPRDIRIVYSPLHGVGASAVVPLLAAAGFRQVELYPDHARPDGDFPNVPGHVSNPENPRVFDAVIDYAQRIGADLALATDPDCDRMGCAAPLTLQPGAAWATLNGNQLGALLTDYVLERRRDAGTLTPQHYVVKTLVTTEFIRRIADSYGVRTCGDLLVGFKWIGGVIDEEGPEHFLIGCEESHGYLVGQYARDKDGAVACLLMSELAARLHAAGKTVHERLAELSQQHGAHAERLLTIQMAGSEGMIRMQRLMDRFRQQPPRTLGGLAICRARDYFSCEVRAEGTTAPLAGPRGDMVIFDLAEVGNSVAVRPSGTEPKIKFYLFAYAPPEKCRDLALVRAQQLERLDQLERDLRALAESV